MERIGNKLPNQNNDTSFSLPKPSMPNGGIVSHTLPGSIAEELAIQPGSILVSINGVCPRDVIDYTFATAEECIELQFHTNAGDIVYDIEKDPDEDLGIAFTEAVFDRVRTCTNACPFCFVTQMPKGLRRTLYVRDDDYRLSFLYGNFITLTNLTEEDWQRIQEQHLSPLYVSMHATDYALRASLLGKQDIPDVMTQIRRLGSLGITVHAQVVLCPGINDGMMLTRTLEDIASLASVIQSVAIVPLGMTRHGLKRNTNHKKRHVLRCYTPAEAASVVEMVLAFGEHALQQCGRRLAYPSDEFFLLCGHDIPPASFYDDFSLYFDGVGMTRDFLDEWAVAQQHLPSHLPHNTRIAIVCSSLNVPLFNSVAARLNTIANLNVHVVEVINTFFGETVTVSGLLTAHDVIQTLHHAPYNYAILPRSMFDHSGLLSLDGYSSQHIETTTGVPIIIAADPNELVHALQQIAHV